MPGTCSSYPTISASHALSCFDADCKPWSSPYSGNMGERSGHLHSERDYFYERKEQLPGTVGDSVSCFGLAFDVEVDLRPV